MFTALLPAVPGRKLMLVIKDVPFCPTWMLSDVLPISFLK
jgi:hypothetical protein